MKKTGTINLKNYLKENFNYLNDKEVNLMAAHAKWLKFDPSEVIIEFEKFERSFFYITHGLIRGYKYIEDWQEYNIFFAESGQSILSPEKLLSKDKKLNTVVFSAINEVRTLKFDHDELLELATQNAGIFEFYHDCLKQITNSLYERVQLLLIENAEDRYRHIAKTRPELIKYAHKKHLAQFMGITPNSFSRLIRKINSVKN